MLRAVRPTLATTGGRLILLSSPYGQAGALWDLHVRHFGRADSPVLIWQGTAPEMNPTLSADYLERMREDDPEGYRSEVLGEFRAGVTALFDPEAIEACVARGVRERLPEPSFTYRAACDPSGGRRDALTVAIGHEVGRTRVVVDVVRAWAAPFNPSGVVSEAADVLRRYHVTRVVGDEYGAEWAAERFREQHIDYVAEKLDRSALYLELLPVVNAGAVTLLDLPLPLRELRGLERRRGVSGRDRIVPDPRDHDDRAIAVAGLVHLFTPVPGPGCFYEFAPSYQSAADTGRPEDRWRWWRCPTPTCSFRVYTMDEVVRCPRCDPQRADAVRPLVGGVAPLTRS